MRVRAHWVHVGYHFEKPPERIEIRIASPIPGLARIVRPILTRSILGGSGRLRW
jgi:hypothetical protein